MKQIFHLASTKGLKKRVSLAIHRVGETLVLDGALDELLESEGEFGDVDPETGEIIMLVPKSRASNQRFRVIDDDEEAEDLPQFLRYCKTNSSKLSIWL